MIAKENNKNFKNCTKCCICDNDYIDNDVKVRDHCHTTGKYRASAHIDSNINFNHKNILDLDKPLSIYKIYFILMSKLVILKSLRKEKFFCFLTDRKNVWENIEI